jgi:hypothetical protein
MPRTLPTMPLMLTLRTPRPDEATILTELCLRSKAVWGYDEAFMLACRNELTLAPLAMQSSHLRSRRSTGILSEWPRSHRLPPSRRDLRNSADHTMRASEFFNTIDPKQTFARDQSTRMVALEPSRGPVPIQERVP